MLSVCALLVLTHCDSGFVPDVGPPPNSSDARAEKIKAWYDTALEEEQNAHLDPQRIGKLAGDSTLLSDSTIAAVLAAMVDQHPPDWDQMETWDNGSGGYIGATLLAGGLGSTSDPDLSVVRTLVADVDENGRVLSGYLVEYVSEDVQESQFKEYVGQWLAGDFGNKAMLVAEYTIGYASTSAMFYAPDKDPRPITIRLVEKYGTGKIDGNKYSGKVSALVLVYWEAGPPIKVGPGYPITTTCVWRDDGGDDDDDGCPPEGCDSGGGDGGDDDDDDDDSQCTEDQKDIAKEYGDETNWPCEKFVDDITSGTGTHGHVTGYHSPAYSAGLQAVMTDMLVAHAVSGWINSDWRCPIGNAHPDVGGVSGSQHVQGTAGDFSAAGFDEEMHGDFEDAGIAAGRRWSSAYGPGGYTGHIHIDWR